MGPDAGAGREGWPDAVSGHHRLRQPSVVFSPIFCFLLLIYSRSPLFGFFFLIFVFLNFTFTKQITNTSLFY